MAVLVLIYGLSVVAGVLTHGSPDVPLNTTAPKDMYVVRATVYQVGILTNTTRNATGLGSGHQESITFYNTNGSNIDMSAIPRPLLTNVTAENVVAVAPISKNPKQLLPWNALKGLTALEPQGMVHQVEASKISKRDVAKIVKGAALIPRETGIQSIALPPLLTLNNNMSKIPVPIPNVSVVSYAKVNTVAHTP